MAMGLFGLFSVLNVFAPSVPQLPSRFLTPSAWELLHRAQSALCLSSALKEPVPLSSFSFISASLWRLSPQVSAAALDFNVRLERTVVAGWLYGTGIDLVTGLITARSGGFLIEVQPSDRVLHATIRPFRPLVTKEVSH